MSEGARPESTPDSSVVKPSVKRLGSRVISIKSFAKNPQPYRCACGPNATQPQVKHPRHNERYQRIRRQCEFLPVNRCCQSENLARVNNNITAPADTRINRARRFRNRAVTTSLDDDATYPAAHRIQGDRLVPWIIEGYRCRTEQSFACKVYRRRHSSGASRTSRAGCPGRTNWTSNAGRPSRTGRTISADWPGRTGRPKTDRPLWAGRRELGPARNHRACIYVVWICAHLWKWNLRDGQAYPLRCGRSISREHNIIPRKHYSSKQKCLIIICY